MVLLPTSTSNLIFVACVRVSSSSSEVSVTIVLRSVLLLLAESASL